VAAITRLAPGRQMIRTALYSVLRPHGITNRETLCMNQLYLLILILFISLECIICARSDANTRWIPPFLVGRPTPSKKKKKSSSQGCSHQFSPKEGAINFPQCWRPRGADSTSGWKIGDEKGKHAMGTEIKTPN